MELRGGADGPLSEPRPGAPRAPGGGDGAATPVLALEKVSRRFGATVALRDATLRVRGGTVHALLGENGAGKSTLVHVAFGHVRPDAGRVLVDGVERHVATPADAMGAGLGMVHQHFSLVPAMTVAENVALGRRGRHDLRRVGAEIARIGTETGLWLDPRALVAELGVAAQQRVEIVKALARGARVLMLDEPTAVLAPDEAAELLAWVRRFADGGGAAVLITHKLREALAVADDVTVLRRGESVLHGRASGLDEAALLAAMVGGGGARGETAAGEEVFRGAAFGGTAFGEAGELGAAGAIAAESLAGGPPREESGAERRDARHHPAAPDTGSAPLAREPATAPPASALARANAAGSVAAPSTAPVIRLDRATFTDERGVVRLHETTLAVHPGEILGVAAVEGSGHHELLRLLAGRLTPTTGRAALPPAVGFVPEDRHRDALAIDLSLVENVALRGAGARRGRMRWAEETARAARILADHDVRAAGPAVPARSLSGGNQQKLVVGRELWGDPAALVAESPTRGLDVRASAAVLARLRAAAARGAAVVVYSSDLDELLALADRVVVVHAGHVREAPREREAVGRSMVGVVA